jgi:hypothetical protein
MRLLDALRRIDAAEAPRGLTSKSDPALCIGRNSTMQIDSASASNDVATD